MSPGKWDAAGHPALRHVSVWLYQFLFLGHNEHTCRGGDGGDLLGLDDGDK